jgi:hypothetical protein
MHIASGVSDRNRTARPTRPTLVLSWNIVEVDRRCGRGIGFQATEIGMITGLARAAAPATRAAKSTCNARVSFPFPAI